MSTHGAKRKKKSKELKKGSHVKLQHTAGEELGAVVDHVHDDGRLEVTIDQEGHELHGKKTMVRVDGLVGATKVSEADEPEEEGEEEVEFEEEKD
jgi:hypothetical protein